MTFIEAIPLLLGGRKMRRKAWRAGCTVCRPVNARGFKFFQLGSDFGCKPWSPYVEDFSANDWIEDRSEEDMNTRKVKP